MLRSKRDARGRRFDRTDSKQLLDEFLLLAFTAEARTKTARCAYTHNKISDTLGSGKNFWEEMRNLGLIPKKSDALHGFMPDKLNAHFSRMKSPSCRITNLLSPSSPDGFSFQQETENDVILAVSHFKIQAKGEHGVPQSIVAKALPVITPHLAKLFSGSLSKGIFPMSRKKARVLALTKSPLPSLIIFRVPADSLIVPPLKSIRKART